MLIRNATDADGARFDVRVAGGSVGAIAERLDEGPDEVAIDAGGGALLPGLHDHHIHLFALAAARSSVCCDRTAAIAGGGLATVLQSATARDGWIRGVDYHESVAGRLDRRALDVCRSDVPVRVQHRSGQAWYLNSKAIDLLGLEATFDTDGIERDERGRATGVLYRCDAWLRDRIGSQPPSLAQIGTELASFGLTGLTDATATNSQREAAAFAEAAERGNLPQRLLLLGAADLRPTPGVSVGALKIVLDEPRLPALDEIVERIGNAHRAQRNVAIHCVTRMELMLALGAFTEAGVREGDRLEHAGITTPECAEWIARLRLCVITQPAFIPTRGDDYLADVDARDLPWLYRCGGLVARDICVGGSSDAPHGPADPWLAMQAAVDRRTRSGRVLDPTERIAPERALALFTTTPEAPGGKPRTIEVGAPADLCLLNVGWARMRERLDRSHVRATICSGELSWQSDA